jgi:hypothetical protein
MMRRQPSAWSIIRTDELCWAIVSGGVPLVLGIGLAIKLTGTLPGRRGGPDVPLDPEVASLVLAGALALTLLLSTIVARRVARVRELFVSGHEIEARVLKVENLRAGGRQRVKYEFEFAGVAYTLRTVYHRWTRTRVFSEGTRIPVMIDRANPKRAIPLAVYGDPNAAVSDGDGPLPANTEPGPRS